MESMCMPLQALKTLGVLLFLYAFKFYSDNTKISSPFLISPHFSSLLPIFRVLCCCLVFVHYWLLFLEAFSCYSVILHHKFPSILLHPPPPPNPHLSHSLKRPER